jgi:DNA-3-methyladenine glycosylase
VARISREFYERYTPRVARELLGSRLVRVVDGERLSGVIVEAEAYRGSKDPASHAYRGRTKRTEVMFGPPGHAYVYFTMGMHHCLNITTEPEGTAAAVLIRALEPKEGVDRMRRNRGVADVLRLATGPGNLTRALGIDRRLNGEDVVSSNVLFLERGVFVRGVGVSPRVGVSSGAGVRWRFFVKGSPFVSKGRPSAQAQNP